MSFERSRLVPATPADVRAEYTRAQTAPTSFERAKWGSRDGMMHRFAVARALVAFDEVADWLDVGCGEAELFELVEHDGVRFDRLVGLDLVKGSLARARLRGFVSPTRFVLGDLVRVDPALGTFGLVTAIGVLQRCGHRPEDFLRAVVSRLAPGGQLFLTTKNLAWREFEKDLAPFPGHSWFDPDEIVAVLAALGVETIVCGGLEPRTGRRVDSREMHTVYLYGRRVR